MKLEMETERKQNELQGKGQIYILCLIVKILIVTYI